MDSLRIYQNLVPLFSLCLFGVLKKITKQKPYQGALTVTILKVVIFCRHIHVALKLEKVGQVFSSFNPRPSLPFGHVCLINIDLHNKTGPLFLEFN